VTDTTNPNPAPTGTPVAPVTPASAPGADVVARLEGEAKVLAEKLAESNTRAGQFAQQIAALTGERDTFKATIAALEPRAAKADELAVKVTDLTNAKHEASLVDALRAKLPGADPLAIRGVLGELHKAGKANRFAEDTAAELARVLPVINAEAPSLTRPPTTGGGSPGARPTPAPQRVSLIRPG
jgi:hypothetical protein